MHELSLALHVVDIAQEKALEAKAVKINSITLDMGKLSGVDREAFEFAWQAATEDTLLEQAKKTIRTVEGKARCNICEARFKLEKLYDPCPNCGSYDREVYQGKDFYVSSISVT